MIEYLLKYKKYQLSNFSRCVISILTDFVSDSGYVFSLLWLWFIAFLLGSLLLKLIGEPGVTVPCGLATSGSSPEKP